MGASTESRCGGTVLSYDQGCLLIKSSSDLEVYKQISACLGCPLEYIGPVTDHRQIVVNGVYSTALSISNACNYTYEFGENGKYLLNFTNYTLGGKCPPIEVLLAPDNPFIPIWILLGIVGLIMTISIGKCILRPSISRLMNISSINDLGDVEQLSPPSEDSPESSPSFRANRILSLDIFRGVTIFLMIIVNAGGGGYWFLQHSVWDGLTLADLVFPWFVWIMGVGIEPRVSNILRITRKKISVFASISQRSLILIGLGIVIATKDGLIQWSEVRLPGVLQRLGVSYFIVSLLFASCYTIDPNTWRDVLLKLLLEICFIAFPVAHIVITYNLHVPGCPTGYTGPGGSSDGHKYSNCTGGAAGYIDRLVFSDSHLYSSGPWSTVYSTTVPYDPEGILGVLSTCFVIISSALKFHRSRSRSYVIHIFSGFFYILFGLSLCNFHMTSNASYWVQGWFYIPINKPLWSISFASIAIGTAELVFVSIEFLVKACHWKGWHFVALGKNSLLIYLGSVLLGDVFPFGWAMLSHGSHFEPLLRCTLSAILWTAIAACFHSKNVYLHV